MQGGKAAISRASQAAAQSGTADTHTMVLLWGAGCMPAAPLYAPGLCTFVLQNPTSVDGLPQSPTCICNLPLKPVHAWRDPKTPTTTHTKVTSAPLCPTWLASPLRLKSSSMYASSTSQKNSLPRRLQNHVIQLGSSASDPVMSSLSSLSDSDSRSTESTYGGV